MSHPIITKKYHFCASHKYGNNNWSEEKNAFILHLYQGIITTDQVSAQNDQVSL